jgi:D-3-phosphoglycerate dehydrogenase
MAQLKVVMVANDMPPTPDWVGRRLAEQGIDLRERACAGPAEVAEAAGDADVVWVMGGARVITAEILPRLRRCRVILRTGTGTDNIPVAAATRLGIVVANTPEATTHQVAEHAVGLLFAVIRQIAVQDRLVRQGVWDRYRAWPDWHLVGQTLGLVGFGRIARLVARKASRLDMTVIASDPAVDAAMMEAHGVTKVSLDDLLERSDFVSIHVPLSEQTRHLIGERELRQMKPRAVLINTSRGEIIDQPALVRALAEGRIAAAGLDVLETEPPARDDPILSLDNVVLTPHIASYSDLFHEKFWSHSVETLIAAGQNGLPIWVVNAEVTPWWQDAPPARGGAPSSSSRNGDEEFM